MAAGFNFGGGFHGFRQGQHNGHPHGGGDSKLYELLGVDRNATESEIKSAYKKQAMQHHPDRGGDEATFKNISKAYEVLSSPEKRQIYDAYGEQGLDNAEQGGGGPGMGTDPFDLFSQIFGFNAAGQRQPRGRPRTQDAVYELQLSLEELYQGTSRTIAFTRDVVCGTCDGRGGHNVRECQRCRGTGQQVHMQQMGVFVQQVASQCSACSGKGYVMDPGDVCGSCKGKTTVTEKKRFSIDVEAGAADGHEFRFSGQAHELPGHDTGDVVVVVKAQPHSKFHRVGDSLVMAKKVSLVEALCGFHFSTPFLDGGDLQVQSKPGQIVKDGDMMTIPGRGMPRQGGQQPGDLFLKLEVDFPSSLSPEQRDQLQGVLGGGALPAELPAGAQTATRMTPSQVQAQKQRWAQRTKRQRQAQPQEGAECVQQ